MKMYNIVLITLLLIIIIPDVFFYFKLKDRGSRPIFIVLHLIPAVLFAGLFLYIKFGLESFQNFRVIVALMWLYYLFFLIYIPKIIHIAFYYAEKIYIRIFHHEHIYFNVIRILFTFFVIMVMLVGAFVTPKRFQIVKVEIPVKNLPEAFNGYKIVQFSDFHLGSWNYHYKNMKSIIKKTNAQNADIIVFTGDMVNNFATETKGWKAYFKELKSKYGKFAILGNHDYGDYVEWKTPAMRYTNRRDIRDSISAFGFKLLLNQNLYLKKGNDSIALVGVEDWTAAKANDYCNLNKALEGLPKDVPKILLSHNPNEFDPEVRGRDDIFLTLSGHTHAAQLGLKFGNKIISPAAFVFKYYAGLYKVGKQYIYVNRGIGHIGLPMEIGVRPEITVITLKRKLSPSL